MSVSSIPGSQAESQEWIALPLLELIEPLESGSRPKGGVRGIDSGIPSVGGEHLTAGGGFNFAKVKFVPKSFYDSMRRGHIRRGDILIVKDGATTGKVALVRDDFPFEEAVVNEHVFIIRPKSDHDSRYIFWYLHSKEGQERVLEHFQGAAQGGINQQFAPGTLVPIPPTRDDEVTIADQIEGLVEGLQSPRDRLATIPTLLKKFRQSVLTAACSGQLTADWRDSQIETDIDDIGSIPETWKVQPFHSIIQELRNGVSPRPSMAPPGVPLLRISSTRAMSVDLDEVRYLPQGERFLPQFGLLDGDLLFTRYNGSLELLGVCGMVRGLNGRSLIYPDKLMRVRLKPEVADPRFIEIFFSGPGARERMTLSSRSTAGQQGVSGKDVKEQLVVLPPMSEQVEIVRRVESLFALADSIESRLAEATAQVERTTQAILAKAFRGEL